MRVCGQWFDTPLRERIMGAVYSGPHVQDSFPPSLSWPAFFNRSGVALPQV